MSPSDADELSGDQAPSESHPRSGRRGSADGESTSLRARARCPGAGARDPGLRRVAGAERGFAALTDLSTRVVRLLQREMDDRVTRGAHRLAVLAADPDVVALSPRRRASWSTRCARIASTTTCSSPTARPAMCGRARCRSITRPACATCSRSSGPGARSTSRPEPFFPNRPRANLVSTSHNPSSNELGIADVRRVREHRPRLGGRVHRTFRPSPEHRPHRSRRSGHRPVSLGGSGEVRRASTRERGRRRSIAHGALGALPASTASSVCTLPSRWSSVESIRAPASRSASRWLPIAPP